MIDTLAGTVCSTCSILVEVEGCQYRFSYKISISVLREGLYARIEPTEVYSNVDPFCSKCAKYLASVPGRPSPYVRVLIARGPTPAQLKHARRESLDLQIYKVVINLMLP